MVSTLAGGAAEYFRGRSGGSSATPGRGLRGGKSGGLGWREGIPEEKFGFRGTPGDSWHSDLNLRGMVYFTFAHNLNYPECSFLMKSN